MIEKNIGELEENKKTIDELLEVAKLNDDNENIKINSIKGIMICLELQRWQKLKEYLENYKIIKEEGIYFIPINELLKKEDL